METALYFSSLPLKISSHSDAFSRVTLVAKDGKIKTTKKQLWWNRALQLSVLCSGNVYTTEAKKSKEQPEEETGPINAPAVAN